MSVIQFLKQVPIFQKLSDDMLNKFSALVETVQYADGEVIFADGSAGDSLYILIEGEVQIYKSVLSGAVQGKDKRSEQVEKIVATLERGEFFGEMALLDKVTRSASARAKGTVSALKISTKNFWDYVEKHPADALQMIILLSRTLSDRLRLTTVESTMVYELGKIFSAGLLPKDLSGRILEQIATVLPEKVLAGLALWNEFNEEYEWVSVNRPAEFPKEFKRNFSRAEPIQKFLEERRTHFHSHNWEEEQLLTKEEKSLYGSFSGSLLVIPIFKSEEHKLLPSGHWVVSCPLSGFFCYVALGQLFAFDKQLIHILTTVAQLTATALENSTHLEEEIARTQHAQRRHTSIDS